MKLASIDIGSNTVLLLLAETNSNNEIISDFNYYKMPRISKGLNEFNKSISKDKIIDLINVLSNYKKLINDFGAEKVLICATNAFRIADNSSFISNIIKEKFDWYVNIISGDEEAKLSFLGVSSSYFSDSTKLVIDIGGGSTELILGNSTEIFYKKSFPIGVVSLTEKFFKNENYDISEIDSAKNHLRTVFNYNSEIPKNVNSIAVAGTPTSLVCMIKGQKEYSNNFVEGNKINFRELNKIILELQNLNGDKILQNYGSVVNGRNDVIFAGSLILNHLMESIELDEITVSSKGLRYGILSDFLNQKKL